MKRLSIAACALLTLNLLTHAIKLILASGFPLIDLWVYALIGLGVIALVYFTTLEASPLYYLYHRECKVYACSALLGTFLGCF